MYFLYKSILTNVDLLEKLKTKEIIQYPINVKNN